MNMSLEGLAKFATITGLGKDYKRAANFASSSLGNTGSMRLLCNIMLFREGYGQEITVKSA